MGRKLVKLGLATAMLIGLGLSGTEAAPMRPTSPEALGLGSAATPAAMCGYSCRSGGRYIPGLFNALSERDSAGGAVKDVFPLSERSPV